MEEGVILTVITCLVESGSALKLIFHENGVRYWYEDMLARH